MFENPLQEWNSRENIARFWVCVDRFKTARQKRVSQGKDNLLGQGNFLHEKSF